MEQNGATQAGNDTRPQTKNYWIRPFEYPTLSGLFGFLLCTLIFLFNGCEGSDRFSSLHLCDKKKVLLQYLERKKGLLNALSQRLEVAVAKPAISNVLKRVLTDSLNRTETTLFQTTVELHDLQHGSADTSEKYFLKYYTIDRTALEQAINSKLKKGEFRRIPVIIHDTASILWKGPHLEPQTLSLEQDVKDTRIAFFKENDVFAFWLAFSLVQMTLWFLLVPLLIGKASNFKITYQDTNLPFTLEEVAKSSLTPAIGMILFNVIFYVWLLDKAVIDEGILISYFHLKMRVYAFFGYLAAVVCFVYYVYSAKLLDVLNTKTGEENNANYNLANDDTKKQKLADLSSLFDAAFLCSAIILSVFVLWLGIFYNAINHMEATRFYELIVGAPYLNYNFVYLVAIMHTLLLLLFYIPIRMKFNSLQLVQVNKETGSTTNKLVSSLFGSLGTVLVTASPLITSVLQSIISNFFE